MVEWYFKIDCGYFLVTLLFIIILLLFALCCIRHSHFSTLSCLYLTRSATLKTNVLADCSNGDIFTQECIRNWQKRMKSMLKNYIRVKPSTRSGLPDPRDGHSRRRELWSPLKSIGENSDHGRSMIYLFAAYCIEMGASSRLQMLVTKIH